MCEFFDIFSKELLCLLLDREIESSIDLVLGTTLISILHYCMTLIVLAKLKKQL